MFSHKHYVPILRWKQAEREALLALTQHGTDISRMTPLFEMVPKMFLPKDPERPFSVDKQLRKVANAFLRYCEWRPLWAMRPPFVDFGLVPAGVRSDAGKHLISAFSSQMQARQLSFVPVIWLNGDPAYRAAVKANMKDQRLGVCVRVLAANLNDASHRVVSGLKKLLSDLDVTPEEVDLLIDYQLVEESRLSYKDLCACLPHLSRWRTFIVAGGSFPVDLTGFAVGEHQLPREEWLVWENQVSSVDLPRKPSFSDYTIQHPIYRQRDFGGMPPRISASIRYTYDSYYLIMRGEAVSRNDGPGVNQWPALAKLLIDREEYCGHDFSAGDKEIMERSQSWENPGSFGDWLRIGFNHHMSLALHQIASLPDV
jgi:hypothetical protein